VDLFLQLFADGLVRGSNIVLLALGFSLALGVSGVFHFAHGAIYTLAAYVVYQGYARMGLDLPLSVIGAFAVCILVGTGVNQFLYKPLAARGTSRLLLVLVSLGVLMIIQALISIIWGTNVLHFQPPESVAPSERIVLGPVVMTHVRVATLLICLGLFAAFYFYFLRRTRYGVAMRALISDPTMARVVGVNKDRIITLTYVTASALAVPGSLLISWEEGFIPGSGFSLILYSFQAIVIGGLGSIPGTFAGGMLMGIVASLAHWKLGGQWETAVIFLVFLVFIIARPTGLFGYKVGKAEL
jgi:branched-chain amino acid transport system permease protein